MSEVLTKELLLEPVKDDFLDPTPVEVKELSHLSEEELLKREGELALREFIDREWSDMAFGD